MNITGAKCEKHGVILETKHERDSCKWYLYCPECEKLMKEALAALPERKETQNGRG